MLGARWRGVYTRAATLKHDRGIAQRHLGMGHRPIVVHVDGTAAETESTLEPVKHGRCIGKR
jgi:hypothetical protein